MYTYRLVIFKLFLVYKGFAKKSRFFLKINWSSNVITIIILFYAYHLKNLLIYKILNWNNSQDNKNFIDLQNFELKW